MKLLIVDENQMLLGQMSKYLSRQDHDVTTVSDGEKALEIMARESFGVCFTDLKMPGIQGNELLVSIMEQHPSTKVVIMTAYGSVRIALKAIKDGAFDFIHKPFQMEQLLDILERIESQAEATVQSS